jgi:hypothetical protein
MATREVIVKVQLENRDAIKQLGQYEADLIAVRKETNALTATIRKNNEATPEQVRRLGELRSSAKALSGNIRELSNETSGLTAAGMRFRDKMAGASLDALKQFGGGILTVTGAIAALGHVVSSAINTIAEFDKAQSNLAAILSTNKEGVRELTEEAKQYGATTAFTATQVTELQTELAKLGFTQTQIKQSTSAVLDLAAATGTDLANAATIAAMTLNAFQLDASETGRVVDVIAQSANLSALDIDTFSAAMSDAAPAAAAVGMSIEDTTAMLSALVDAGIPAEKAGTDLRNIFIKLAASGMTLEEAYAEITGSQDQLTTSVGLFDQRAAGSALILANNTEKLERLKEGYNNAAGAAAEMAEKQLDNLRGDQLLLTSAWEGFVLSVEDGSGIISGAMRGITQSVTDLITSLSGANEETSSFTSRVLGLLTGSSIIQGYEDTAKWWNRLFGSDAQEEINATAQAIQGVATATNELPEFEVVGERATVGRELDKLKTKLEELKEARNNLTLSDIAGRKEVDADIKSTEASIAALEGRTTATKAQAAVVRLLTDEMRAFQAAQKAINEGQGIGMMDVITPTATPIADPADRLLPGTAITDNLRDNLSETATLTTDYTNLFMNMSTAIGQSLGDSFGEIEDANKRITLSILEMVRNAARMYIAMAMAREIGTKGFIGLGTGIALTVAIEAALAAAINNIKADGFAQGGVVRQSDGPRYTRNPGDSVLISAAPGEVVMTRDQQRRANMAAGFDVFRAARVPGFAVGGMVQSRGTALVNSPTAPRPSPDSLSGIRNAFQQAPIFVRVSEINAVQGTVARITERASL